MLEKFIQKQLNLFFGHSEQSLKNHLESCAGRPMILILTDNTTSMLSARVRDGILCVRLHRMFLGAGTSVINEIASMLKHRKRVDMPEFRRFVNDNRGMLRTKPPQRWSVKTNGRYHDLRELFDEINSEYFDNAIDSIITWGSRCSRSAVRRRTLGSYSGGSNIIRINPVLDKKTVPRYFVAFVIYHEMLHAAIGALKRGERRVVHSREFRKRERCFRDYDRAIAWEKRSS